jgi:hypothetical protein
MMWILRGGRFRDGVDWVDVVATEDGLFGLEKIAGRTMGVDADVDVADKVDDSVLVRDEEEKNGCGCNWGCGCDCDCGCGGGNGSGKRDPGVACSIR